MSHPHPSPFVEVGDPGYSAAVELAEMATATVDATVEQEHWAPRDPAPCRPGPIAFIDGVQQVEAWLTVSRADEPGARAGLACAVGAGVVLTAPGERARVTHLRLQRLVMVSGHLPLHLPAVGGFQWDTVADGGLEPSALQRSVGAARQRLEHSLADAIATDERLVVLDGPLTHLRDTPAPLIGAIKSHLRMYLEGERLAVVRALQPGQRTPLFAVGEDRYSWYQRLPVADCRGWAGILRGEVARGHGVVRAAALADRATALLPAFAGRPHRDARAPQNLGPIAGLEQRLRHRLGDRRLALRAVRRAARHATMAGWPTTVAIGDPEHDEETAA